MKIKEAAINVLQETRQPLTAKEIADRIMSAGLWKTAGKTPAATVFLGVRSLFFYIWPKRSITPCG